MQGNAEIVDASAHGQDQPSVRELLAEIDVLKRRLAEQEREMERLRQAASACCPWRMQAWHRYH